MKQVVDGKHVSPQVEQYENNLNECLWLSIFVGGMASGESTYAYICLERRSVLAICYIKGWQCGGMGNSRYFSNMTQEDLDSERLKLCWKSRCIYISR